MLPQTPGIALIRRELITDLRRPRSFVVLALFVCVCIADVVWLWPDDLEVYGNLSVLSNLLLEHIALLLLVACILLVPALAAAALAVEHEENTLDLLRATPLRPSSILFGKLVGVLGFFVLLMIAVMPVLSTVFFLVGVDWTALLETLAVLIATAAACAGAGLLSSARCRRTTWAVFGSYGATLLLMIAGPIVGFIAGLLIEVVGFARFTAETVWFAATMGTPLGMLDAIVSGHVTPAQVALSAGLQLLFAYVCLYLAHDMLRRSPIRPRHEGLRPIDNPSLLRARRLTFPFYLVDPLKRKKPIEDGRNPVLVRELRWGLLDRADTMIRTFYVAFGIYMLIGGFGYMARVRGGSLEYYYVVDWLMMQFAVTVAITPALLATALTREYESGNIDMLRITLLTPGEIIRGKLLAGSFAAAPLLLAAMASALSILGSVWKWAGLLMMGYITLALCVAICLALALFASLLTRHTTSSLILTYLFTLALFLGTWVLFKVVSPASVLTRCWLQSPIAVFYQNAETHAGGGLFSMYWLLNTGAYSMYTATLVALTLFGFARYRYRDT